MHGKRFNAQCAVKDNTVTELFRIASAVYV